jgi:hypothetical protein
MTDIVAAAAVIHQSSYGTQLVLVRMKDRNLPCLCTDSPGCAVNSSTVPKGGAWEARGGQGSPGDYVHPGRERMAETYLLPSLRPCKEIDSSPTTALVGWLKHIRNVDNFPPSFDVVPRHRGTAAPRAPVKHKYRRTSKRPKGAGPPRQASR